MPDKNKVRPVFAVFIPASCAPSSTTNPRMSPVAVSLFFFLIKPNQSMLRIVDLDVSVVFNFHLFIYFPADATSSGTCG